MRIEARTPNATALLLAVLIASGAASARIYGAQTAGRSQGKIAFQSDRSGNGDIYVMNADGSAQRRLTRSGVHHSPAWSPDGRRIAVVRDDAIWVMSADGSSQRRLTRKSRLLGNPAWSPNGRRIAFNADCSIHVMNADGSAQRRLPAKVDCAEDPAWSPDGRRIAFSQNPLDPFTHIWVMNADGSEPRRLTRNRTYDFDPAWSPDGRKIAFARDPTQPGGTDPGGALYIYVMDADGGFQRQLTWFGDEYDPTWSPDGRRIAFASDREFGSDDADIYVVNADGSGERRLTRSQADERAPAWSAGAQRAR